MIPAGYMAKRVSSRIENIRSPRVVDIYSVSSCMSENFVDYIPYRMRHNRYGFFDSPEIIFQLALENSIDLNRTHLFFYEVYELEYDIDQHLWKKLTPLPPGGVKVVIPSMRVLEGYDIATVYEGGGKIQIDHSPLSCNALARNIETNSHCLLDLCEQTIRLMESDMFTQIEPGPYRIYSVYSAEESL